MSNELAKTDQTPEIIISVSINGEIVRRNLSDDLKVDEKNINDYLQRSPGLTAYWNMLYEKQRSITTRAKVAMERKRAAADTKIRRDFSMDEKKITDKQVDAIVSCDPDFILAEDNYLMHHETELTLRGAVEAIKELRSTLISLSANMRSEGVIRINKAQSVTAEDPEQSYKSKFKRSQS